MLQRYIQRRYRFCRGLSHQTPGVSSGERRLSSFSELEPSTHLARLHRTKGARNLSLYGLTPAQLGLQGSHVWMNRMRSGSTCPANRSPWSSFPPNTLPIHPRPPPESVVAVFSLLISSRFATKSWRTRYRDRSAWSMSPSLKLRLNH